MGDKDISELLTLMIGKNAFNNSMKVSSDFGNLVKAVNYLTIQLKITGRWCDEEGKEHIKGVIESTKEILKGEL
jgi:hypothetical protein